MKTSIYLLSFVAASWLVSCSDSSSSAGSNGTMSKSLSCKWEWVATMGELPEWQYTPANTGQVCKLELSDQNELRVFSHNILVAKSTYTLDSLNGLPRLTANISTLDSIFAYKVIFNGAVILNNDSLEIGYGYLDGHSSFFIRK